MALIRNTASMRLTGRVGNTSYYTQGGRQVARVSQNSSNYGETARRTLAQQKRRVKWSNLVNFYRISANWMKGSFETKTRKESDYNKFMSVNLANARVNLTKREASTGACVLDQFVISQGSLMSLSLSRAEGKLNTGLVISPSHVGEDITVAEFSRFIVSDNPQLSLGMQLSFLVYAQLFTDDMVPHVTMERFELTIDTSDQSLLQSRFGRYTLSVSDNILYIGNISDGTFVSLVVSDNSTGALRVSTQSLLKGTLTTAEEYATPEKELAAAESYGIDVETFLTPGY